MWRSGFLIVCPLLLAAGCAGDSCLRPVSVPAVTPSVVSASGGHVGKPTQWGGTLIESHHLKDHTELEVVAYPLDDCGRPRIDSNQTGRFIIVYPGFLETADYRTGRAVSATGRMVGVRKGRLGEVEYSFPLLESYKVHLWPEKQAHEGHPSRPWINLGIGGGDGGVFGGIGVIF